MGRKLRERPRVVAATALGIVSITALVFLAGIVVGGGDSGQLVAESAGKRRSTRPLRPG